MMPTILKDLEPKDWISSGLAIIAVLLAGASFYVAERRITPRERPILSLKTVNAEREGREGYRQRYQIRFEFMNIGLHPARDVRLRAWWFTREPDTCLGQIVDVSSANRIDPEATIATPINPVLSWSSVQAREKLESGIPTALYVIKVDYSDAFSEDNYTDEILWRFDAKSGQSGHGSLEDQDHVLAALKGAPDKCAGATLEEQ